MNQEALAYEADGYLLKKCMLSLDVCELLSGYATLSRDVGRLMPADPLVPTAPALYGDPVVDALLTLHQARIEVIVGASLWPTYSYLRIYNRGDKLPVHKDRPACEITVSICLEADVDWPLWLRVKDGDRNVVLKRGEGVIYEGVTTPHWREPLVGLSNIQCMLHYVRQNGLFVDERFDRRPSLGRRFVRRQQTADRPSE